jgi:transcriptional regulator with XRE-family HTH domain
MGLNEIIKIGDKIKCYRKNLDLTQEQLASKCDISKNAIWNYENNKRVPDADTLNKIAKSLGVSISDLISEMVEKEEVSINMNINVSLKDTDLFKEFINLFKQFIEDKRIADEIKIEAKEKINVLLKKYKAK